MNYKMIDALLDADRNLVEGWGEASALGRSDIFDHVSLFMDVNCNNNVTILNVFDAVKCNDKLSTNAKWHALEGLACGLGHVACKVGFIEKYRIKNPLKITDLIALELM